MKRRLLILSLRMKILYNTINLGTGIAHELFKRIRQNTKRVLKPSNKMPVYASSSIKNARKHQGYYWSIRSC